MFVYTNQHHGFCVIVLMNYNSTLKHKCTLKGIVHFEINFWNVLAYLKSIKDVGVFVSTVFSILTFFGQTIVVYQSYNAGLGGPHSVHLEEHAQRSQNETWFNDS